MKTYFTFREAANGRGWIFCPVLDEFLKNDSFGKGSYNLLGCRISGLSWVQWLKYCCQNGAILYGKNHKYVVPIWKEQNKHFLDLMNHRANQLAQKINFKDLHF